MANLANKAILSGADNRPPMLEKDMYDSWKSRMELYMMNRQNGRMILEFVENGPLIWPTIEENGVTRPRKYAELTPTKAIQADCDVKPTNVILQGLPPEVYAFFSNHRIAKELWERIQLLLQGTSLTKQERECKLYDEFDKFAYKKGETLRDFYLRFSLLLNDMNIYNVKLEQFQDELAFLADLRITEGQVTQTVITYNVAYQADDLDVYDSDYDELNTAKVALMAHLSHYYSEALAKIHNPDNADNNTINQDLNPFKRPTKVEVPKELPKVSMVVQIILRYLDFGCSKHMTRDRSQFTNFVNKYLEFCDSKLEVAFRQHTCFIRNLEGVGLLIGSRGNNLYTLSLGNMMVSSLICLLSNASKIKSWLWHQRLSHLNFGTINHLARHGLVRCHPKLKFEKDHMCSSCAMGKSKKKPDKPKSEYTNQEKLYLLHMDLCSPMHVVSVNGKKYILVIVDDYSRFTWVKCLRSKDKAPDFVIKLCMNIMRKLASLVKHLLLALHRKMVSLKDEIISCSEPALNEMIPATIYSGLMPNPPSSTPFVPPLRIDWDLLFQPLFDELLTPSSSVDHPALKVIAPIAEVVASEPATSTGLPSSTTVNQDPPSPNVAHMNNDPFFGVEESPKTPTFYDDPLHESLHEDSTSQGSSSNMRQTYTLFESLGAVDPTLFTRKAGNDLLLVQIYVDDIIFASTNTAMCNEFANLMTSKFKMSMMGQMSFFLGLQISQSPRGIFINQSKYAFEIVKKYDMLSSDSVDTPLVEKSKLDEDLQGKLVDAHFTAKPTKMHLNAVKRVFQYLKGTINMGLRIMSITKEQQQALDDALVPREQPLRIGNCNFRLITIFKPKEPTVQVSLDVVSLIPFYQAFLISASVSAIYMLEF
nr:uncharacterized mitochondrial protein AtMg00810-like [Tanacetum cinerariifolium]